MYCGKQWLANIWLIGALAVSPFIMPQAEAKVAPQPESAEIAAISIGIGGRHHGRHHHFRHHRYDRPYRYYSYPHHRYYNRYNYPGYYYYYNDPYYYYNRPGVQFYWRVR